MTLFLTCLFLLTWSPALWAKTLTVSKDAKHVNQLHDELLAAFPTWKGTQHEDGSYENPLLHVEWSGNTIKLTVPDNADEKAIDDVLKAHVPQTPKDYKQLRLDAIQNLKDNKSLTDDQLKALGY